MMAQVPSATGSASDPRTQLAQCGALRRSRGTRQDRVLAGDHPDLKIHREQPILVGAQCRGSGEPVNRAKSQVAARARHGAAPVMWLRLSYCTYSTGTPRAQYSR